MVFVEIFIVAVLIFANGVLAMSELAIVSSRPARLKAMIDQGVKGSRRALALASDPGRFLSTVQIGITLVGIVAGAFSGTTLSARFAAWLIERGATENIAEPVAFGLVVAVITYFSVIIGELVPKQLALRDAEKVACLVAPAMTMLARIGSPIVWLLDVSGKAVLLLFGGNAVSDRKVTDEEIKALVAEAESTGVLEPEERALIAGVMRLGDRPVRAVMTPRREVDLIDITADLETIKQRIAASDHSRLPVCEGSEDDVIGVIQAKNLLDAYLEGEPINPRAFVQNAPVIPDTMAAVDVIGVLRESPIHIGLVHDEYGHFRGVVTAVDILEAIGGDYHDAAEPADARIVKRADGSYLVSGSMPAEEFSEKLGIALTKDRSYHTVAGLVLYAFGRLPECGEITRAYGWTFEVLDLDGRRIDKVLVSRSVPRRRVAT